MTDALVCHNRQRAVERDAIVFLIDARPRMYEPMADGTRPLDAVLQAAVDTLEAKIIQVRKNTTGIVKRVCALSLSLRVCRLRFVGWLSACPPPSCASMCLIQYMHTITM